VWGCHGPSVAPSPGEEPFLYEMGTDGADNPIILDRCPLSLTRNPFARIARRNYALYLKGITPNGRGSRHESALYTATMLELALLEGEAEDWYLKEKSPKPSEG